MLIVHLDIIPELLIAEEDEVQLAIAEELTRFKYLFTLIS
jgi:hypothetical protein